MKSVSRPILVFLMTWGLLHGIGSLVRLTPDWPPAGVAAVVAAVVEGILRLHRFEAAAVTPSRARWIVGLRLAALAVLVWILIEPVWVRKVRNEIRREVVVLLDDSGSMHLKDDGTDATRIALGEAALEKSGIKEALGEKLRVRVVKAARSLRVEGGKETEGWGDATDLTGALATVLEQVRPDDLAGVLMVSDGRHNRPEPVEKVARRFGQIGAPVGIVAVGGAEPPRDASILTVRAPEAIHLGDRMRMVAELKFDGYKGKKAKVRLMRDGRMLDEREISIPQDHHREEVRFTHVPEQGGVGSYQVEIASLEGEKFAENNRWDFETSITDARTNVLIIESYPRWEFRYLRNLFYGRDKSVNLQYVLLHPDEIENQADVPVAASAARPFGESLATRLPATEEEWRKFDVIIIGDVDPQVMNGEIWTTVSRCVNERAALLVMIAGPRHMPHSIDAEAGRALVPAEIAYGQGGGFARAGGPFRLGLTPDGQRHPVTQQSTGDLANERIWSGFPQLHWRHPVTGIKEGAGVLLTATTGGTVSGEVGGGSVGMELDDIARRKKQEAESALLVVRQTGKGKVALLLTDRTWRLREGAGDLYHHRFWGNLVRWGAGPVLRSGGERARIGTDQLTYTPDDRPRLTARLRDHSLNPVDDKTLRAEVLRDGKVLATLPMTPLPDSNGLYETNLDRFTKTGKYEVRLRGDTADGLIKEDGAGELKTGFKVAGSVESGELAETTLNLPLLQTIATLSGGKVVSADKVGDLSALFLTDKNDHSEIRESSLWDNGWVLALLAALLGGGWVIRRTGGLP